MTLSEQTEEVIREIHTAIAASRAARGASAEARADGRLAEAMRDGLDDSWHEEE